MALALEGIRALDFTILGMGPIAAQWLGDLGAEVIKVERVEGDSLRPSILAMDGERSAPLLGGDSPSFMALNRNKRSIALDLKHPRAKELVLRLAERADVILSTFRPGVMEGLGLGYEAIRRINPRVIYYTGSGFGSSGPYARKKGQDLVAQAMGGLMSMTGDRDSPPTPAGTYLADYVGGALGALAIITALFHRERTGQGQRVENNLLDAVIGIQPIEGTAFLNTGIDWVRGARGTAHAPGSAAYGVYKTQDIDIVVVGSLAQVCEGLGIENLEEDSRFDTPEKRCQRQEELRRILGAVFATKPGRDWVRQFEDRDLWVGPVNTFRETSADPQVACNGMVLEVDHPAAGRIRLVGAPVHLAETPPGVRRPPPMLGEHTDEILREIGYTPAQIREMRRLKAVR